MNVSKTITRSIRMAVQSPEVARKTPEIAKELENAHSRILWQSLGHNGVQNRTVELRHLEVRGLLGVTLNPV